MRPLSPGPARPPQGVLQRGARTAHKDPGRADREPPLPKSGLGPPRQTATPTRAARAPARAGPSGGGWAAPKAPARDGPAAQRDPGEFSVHSRTDLRPFGRKRGDSRHARDRDFLPAERGPSEGTARPTGRADTASPGALIPGCCAPCAPLPVPTGGRGGESGCLQTRSAAGRTPSTAY